MPIRVVKRRLAVAAVLGTLGCTTHHDIPTGPDSGPFTVFYIVAFQNYGDPPNYSVEINGAPAGSVTALNEASGSTSCSDYQRLPTAAKVSFNARPDVSYAIRIIDHDYPLSGYVQSRTVNLTSDQVQRFSCTIWTVDPSQFRSP